MVNGEQVTVNGSAPSQAALGRALNLSPAAVTKLKKQGMPVHSVDAAMAWRHARLNIAQRKPDPPAAAARAPAPPPVPAVSAPDESFDSARTRQAIADADKAELLLAELRGELMRVDDVQRGQQREHAALREGFLQLPDRVVPLLAADPEPAKMLKILRTEINAVLAALSQEGS